MSIVSAKCPNCGASIQLNNEQNDGFCSYCGSKLKIQEAISLVKIDNTSNIRNYLHLTKNALNCNNGEEAYVYASKILEIDSANGEAWLFKMRSLDFLGSLQNMRELEIITAGNNAILFGQEKRFDFYEFLENQDVEDAVYSFFLLKALAIIDMCQELVSNTQEIKQLYDANFAVNPFSASEETMNFDDSFVTLVVNTASGILDLKCAIPIDKLKSNEIYIELLEELTAKYVSFVEALCQRYRVYGAILLDSAVEAQRIFLNDLKEGLSEEQKQKIPTERITNSSSGGCYIATAIYGSYNAPEVIVLRCFRDAILSKRCMGRFFIRVYYTLSPPIAEKLKDSKYMNIWVKALLDRWVAYLINRRYFLK